MPKAKMLFFTCLFKSCHEINTSPQNNKILKYKHNSLKWHIFQYNPWCSIKHSYNISSHRYLVQS